MTIRTRKPALLVRSGGRICALPIAQVVETLRPLPVAPVAGTAPFVRGGAVIRGEPVPVVDLEALLTGGEPAPFGRLVVIRCGERHAALAVQAVLGVEHLDLAGTAWVPLLAGAARGAVDAVASRDRDLLLVLDAARAIPESAWRALRAEGSGA